MLHHYLLKWFHYFWCDLFFGKCFLRKKKTLKFFKIFYCRLYFFRLCLKNVPFCFFVKVKQWFCCEARFFFMFSYVLYFTNLFWSLQFFIIYFFWQLHINDISISPLHNSVFKWHVDKSLTIRNFFLIESPFYTLCYWNVYNLCSL